MYLLTRTPAIYLIVAVAAVALTVSASTTAPVYAAHHSHESSESILLKAVGGQPSGYENAQVTPVDDQANGPQMAADQGSGNGNNPVADQANGPTAADQAYGPTAADQAYGPTAADQAYGPTAADQAYGPTAADQAYGPTAAYGNGINPLGDQMNGDSSGYSGPNSMHADYHHHNGHVSTLGVVADAW
jgi:hypothetical protein